MSDSSRTEQPTQQRLRKAREEGRFPVSREFVGSMQFVTFVAVLSASARDLSSGLSTMLRECLVDAFRIELTSARVCSYFSGLLSRHGQGWLLVGSAVVVAALATSLATTQLGIASSQLAPSLARLSPVGRLKSLPAQNFAAAFQASLLLPALAGLVVAAVVPRIPEFLALPYMPVQAGAALVFGAIEELLWRGALIIALFGSIDLFRQRRRYRSQLRMTPQEVREEHRQNEGDPHTKARIRRIQRDLLRRNMMREIPRATAVIVNPVHYAVAIRYEKESMAAPLVLAKGRNYLALRIRSRAEQHGVPVVENPPLARALYTSADVGQEIPPALYRAVAEVLAYVMRLAGARGNS